MTIIPWSIDYWPGITRPYYVWIDRAGVVIRYHKWGITIAI